MPLDPKCTQRYMRDFYGFGNSQARWCFVGLEEGGGGDYPEVEARLNAWKKRGCRQLEDLPEYANAVGHGLKRWFDGEGKLQSTWNKLIHLLLTAQGLPSDRAARRNYQSKVWGRHGSETLLTDIYPLPSPGRVDWQYGEWVDIPQLANRGSYHAYVEEFRLAALRELILPAKGPGRIVVIYALARHRDRIRLLSNLIGLKKPIEVPMDETMWMAKVGSHLVAVVAQPAGRGSTLNYFADIGLKIRKKALQMGILEKP